MTFLAYMWATRTFWPVTLLSCSFLLSYLKRLKKVKLANNSLNRCYGVKYCHVFLLVKKMHPLEQYHLRCGTLIQQSARGLAKCVHYNRRSLYQGPFHTFYCYLAEKYGLLYWGLCCIGVCYIRVPLYFHEKNLVADN